MAHDPYIVHVTDTSELARLLEKAAASSLRLELHGVLYRISREDTPSTEASGTEKGNAALHLERAIGSWQKAGIDAEAFKRYISERRHTANRPSVRL